MFLRKYWLPLSVFIVAIAVVCVYMIQTQSPKEPIKIYKTVKPTEKPTPQAPIGETSQGGHFHADGTWHREPHTPVEVSADVQDALLEAQQGSTQITAPMQDASDVNRAWVEWARKHRELSEKFSQAAREDTAILPTTKEEQERFDNDPEWQRRYSEALHKTAKIYGMMKALEKDQPPRP